MAGCAQSLIRPHSATSVDIVFGTPPCMTLSRPGVPTVVFITKSRRTQIKVLPIAGFLQNILVDFLGGACQFSRTGKLRRPRKAKAHQKPLSSRLNQLHAGKALEESSEVLFFAMVTVPCVPMQCAGALPALVDWSWGRSALKFASVFKEVLRHGFADACAVMMISPFAII